MAPSTFASAAAGNNANTSRADSGGEWSRRPNGATQTFRRPSLATTLSSSSHQRDGSGAQSGTAASNVGPYIPPHLNTNRNGTSVENRYSKDQLLQLFRAQKDSDDLADGLSGLYVGEWEPNAMNGASGASWGRGEDHRDRQLGADVCWENDGSMSPLGMVDMTEEERELFSTSVNSPLKAPMQNTKENTPKESASLRKSSVSQSMNSPGNFGLASPTTSRPGNRRRDTSEAYPFPAGPGNSPGGLSRFSREDSSTTTPPPALLRRRTDFKEAGSSSGADDREKEKSREDTSAPIGSLKRSTTGPFSAGLNGPSSPWSSTPQSAGYSPMGAFGSFALGANSGQSSTVTDKRSGFGSTRGESRFKGLMAKDSSEESGQSLKEKSSLGNLDKVEEVGSGRQTPSWAEARANRPLSNDTDPYPEDEMRTGSAALGGGQDDSPLRPDGIPSIGTPSRPDFRDDSGFSAFGMTSDTGGFRDSMRNREMYQHNTPQQLGNNIRGPEPMSPTDTNPYQSPEHDKTDGDDIDTDGSDIHNAHLPGLGSFVADQGSSSGLPGLGSLANLNRGSVPYDVAASDRSQTSSVGPTRGFPSLGGLGGLPGLGGASAWQTGQLAVGTPSRERSGFVGAFGEGIFGSSAEVQSPGLAGLGSNSIFGTALGTGISGSGTLGRGSKMGSLFPAAMQEQMRAGEQSRQANEEGSVDGNERPQTGLGSFGRSGLGNNATGTIGSARDTDSPFRSNRGLFDDLLGSTLRASEQPFGANEPLGAPLSQAQSSAPLQNTIIPAAIGQQRSVQQPALRQTQSVTSSASSQPPAAQQRTMVMPDRMRWIYRDPQGNTQGPWSGLEMHEWYKAGFFSPELLVKKAEDPDYEPLAQLIRRIGNSREPFLVPQIGIPHGPPSTQAGNAWAAQTPLMTGPTSSSAAQPPFASSFPSFGTTLTAEQQNALERRKQEEQYLMARQKEHLAQQQVLAKMQMSSQHGILPQQLHHHSSAHSLHSQPSFGSITSPTGYQPSPTQAAVPGAAVPGFFDNSFRPPPVAGMGPIGGGIDMLGNIREEEVSGLVERLNLGRNPQVPFGGPAAAFGQQQPSDPVHVQQIAAMLNDRVRLQREQAEYNAMQQRLGHNEQEAAQLSADRLQQYHELRAQLEAEQDVPAFLQPEGVIGEPTAPSPQRPQLQEEVQAEVKPNQDELGSEPQEAVALAKQPEMLSLTEQVQKAASAKQAPMSQSPWVKIDTALPQPFPPPQSSSPIPAPVAQRKQNLADALNAETRSPSQTPSVDTPSASIAPWAKESTEAPKAPKGPSLKEIQAMEAKKAAQQEELAAAARRAAMEKELLAQANAPVPAPGLPSSSTWASSASPVTPSSASTPFAWAKPLAGKAASQTTAAAKKTLQQIQKEEEARKQRAAAAANVAIAGSAAIGAVPSLASGKRYADLASKVAAPAPSNAGGAWTTVGASGKVKTPAAPIPTGPAAGARAVSGGAMPSAAAKPKPAAPARSTPVTNQVNAQEEFKKWAIGELRYDLNKGINVDDFVQGLLSFPSEMDVITEAVHSVSQTMDSRHFAEEFIRRRKLADKGIVDSSHSASPAAAAAANDGKGGGWSEVAKKGPSSAAREEPNNFKVVAAKKKGGKR